MGPMVPSRLSRPSPIRAFRSTRAGFCSRSCRETVDPRGKTGEIHRERRRQTTIDQARAAFLDHELADRDRNGRLWPLALTLDAFDV